MRIKNISLALTFFYFFQAGTFAQKIIRPKEIIKDKEFACGIMVQGNQSSSPAPIDTLHPFHARSNDIYWMLPQWGSRNVLKNTSSITKKNAVVYKNDAKKISFYKRKNQHTEIEMEVLGSTEYHRPRKADEEWIHLLLEQNFQPKTNLSETVKLIYKTRFKLVYCENKTGSGYNSDLHTAQFTQYLAIEDGNKKSTGYGDFLWFGLPFYDYRYPDVQLYAAKDTGKTDATQKFIYTMASRDLFGENPTPKKWIIIDRDILPFVKKAYQTAKENGYLKNTTFEDLTISSMNIGWEIPGTFDCGMLFRSPSLTAIFR